MVLHMVLHLLLQVLQAAAIIPNHAVVKGLTTMAYLPLSLRCSRAILGYLDAS